MKQRVLAGTAIPLWMILTIGQLWASVVFAQQLRVTGIQVAPDGKVTLNHPAKSDSYYILYRGSNVVQIILATDMALGVAGPSQLKDNQPSRSAGFYRIEQVPISSPKHSDGDGIDDVWELQHRAQLNPLNTADAQLPSAGPGSPTWKQVYDAERAVGLAAFASFTLPNSRYLESAGSIGIEVRFSKPYSGPLKFQVGGTAIAGRDFDPNYTQPAGESFTGSVTVNGTNAVIPIRLRANDFIEPERSLVLTLQQPAATNAYRLGSPSTHLLSVTEGDRGVFGGAVFFTNGVLLGSQPVKLALRSGPEVGIAFFDTSGATLFQRRPVSLPVQFNPNGPPFAPLGTAAGTLASDVFGHALDWTLELIQPVLETNTLSAGVNLRLRGLSATGREVLAQGVLVVNRMDATP